MAPLIEAVRADLRKRGLMARGERMVVGVSGGLDSMVLLTVLHRLAADEGWSLVVAHFDHGLRGATAERDEAFVRAVAARLRIECECGAAGNSLRVRSRGVSVEMAARVARHAFLAGVAVRHGARTIALGHHADDQVETVLLRLFRGAGVDGMAGMRWASPSPANAAVTIVRPLLGQRRSDLRDFAASAGVKWKEDESNRCEDMARNWLRRDLIPRLRRRLRDGATAALLRASELLAAEGDFVAGAARAWREGKRQSPFTGLHLAVQRRVIVEALIAMGVEPGFDLVEWLRGRPDAPWMVQPGRTVWHDGRGELHWGRGLAANRPLGEIRVPLTGAGGQVDFGGKRFRWRIFKRRGVNRVVPRPGCERFDADRVGGMIVLRGWRAGDRFWPIGSPAEVKLQDLFTNLKVPRAQRGRRVIMVDRAGALVWVEGLRMAEAFKIRPTTRHWLEWRWDEAHGDGCGGQGSVLACAELAGQNERR